MEKVGLKIVELIYDIAKAGYGVTFTDDLDGMLTVTYSGKNTDWTDHEHLGIPGCDRLHLEKEIIRSLAKFSDDHVVQE